MIKNRMFYVTLILIGSFGLAKDSRSHTPDEIKQNYTEAFIDGWIEGRKSNPVIAHESLDHRRLYWAVARTESHNTDALPDSKISIRYEPHWLSKCMRFKRWSMPKSLPSKLWRKVPRSKWKTQRWKNNYKYLALAKRYGDKVAEGAHCATSYGKFQIMGMHHSLLGFKTAREMSDQYHVNATDAFNFMKFKEFLTKYRGGKCDRQLKKFQFNEFAKCYNGDVRYARKLRANYQMSKGVIKS